MSFLDAVISSIGTGGGSSYVPPPKRVPGEPPGTYSIIGRPSEKNEPGNPADSSTAAAAKASHPTVVNGPSSLAGTKRKAEDGPRKSTGSSNPSSLPSGVLAAKKKNSFAAIMARGKEASAKNDPTSIGSIKHKPKEKSRAFKEIVAERKAAKEAIRKGIPVRGVLDSKSSANKVHLETKKSVGEERPQTATSGYKGTIKTTGQPKYTGTMKPASGTSKHSGTARSGYSGTMQSGRNPAAAKRSGRGYEDDDSDNSYGRDDDGYYDASDDDMDAGFDDVEDEEEVASRVARREDALAQAELDRLATEKAKKKALLAKGKH